MLSKHGRQWYDPQQTPTERLQANIDALASSNLISAARTESLLEDAQAAGVQGCEDVDHPTGTLRGPELWPADLRMGHHSGRV